MHNVSSYLYLIIVSNKHSIPRGREELLGKRCVQKPIFVTCKVTTFAPLGLRRFPANLYDEQMKEKLPLYYYTSNTHGIRSIFPYVRLRRRTYQGIVRHNRVAAGPEESTSWMLIFPAALCRNRRGCVRGIFYALTERRINERMHRE